MEMEKLERMGTEVNVREVEESFYKKIGEWVRFY